MSAINAMQDYIFTSKYARWSEDEQRRETWDESVDRVRDMMLQRYADNNIDDDINWAYDMMTKKRVLGSQRALQFGGKPIFKKNARMFNCLSKDTKFVTSEGVKSFKDYNSGDEISVLTHTGQWQNAIIQKYGKATLRKKIIKRGRATPYEVWATDDHRWLLSSGEFTSSVQDEDLLASSKDIFNEFDFDSATPEERVYWCYGFVYGDGTKVKDKEGLDKYSMVRLCGSDIEYKYRFEQVGFKTSQPHSCEGDFFAYTGSYTKTSPDPTIDNPQLIRAFVHGYLDADGAKNRNKTNNRFRSIQSSEKDHIEFIRKCFPIAGVYIVAENDLTGQKTNFGIRPYTIDFRIINDFSGTSVGRFKIYNTNDTKVEEVWCLEVEEDKSFVLPNGVITGNCCYSHCDRPRFFQEYLWLLLCGCGAGFSVQKHHVIKLPKLKQNLPNTRKTFVIPDTIEGWSDALGILLSTYFETPTDPRFQEWCDVQVTFDYSEIRAKGSPLSSGVGKAPGPDGLRNSLKHIDALLAQTQQAGARHLRPIDVYDICMHTADAVLSGGVRRSATIALFSADDEEMATAKTGNWFETHPHRARSNNSAVLVREHTTKEQFTKLMQHVKDCGEPGFVWTSSVEAGFNPCVEIQFFPYYPTDMEKFKAWKEDHAFEPITCDPAEIGLESCWHFCNLTTTNCSKLTGKTREDKIEYYLENVKAAAIIGTLQAGFTTFHYLTDASKKLADMEALLGVSMTGMMDNYEIVLDPVIQEKAAKLVLSTNAKIAKRIGINIAARATCLKPEGTGTLILGCSAHGCHPHHYVRYLRAIQANTDENIYKYFKKHNTTACEKSKWSANATDDIVYFPIEVPDGAKTKNQLPAVEMLKIVKSTQQHWVKCGKRSARCIVPWLDHNVSNTVTVKPDEWDEVTDFIYKNRRYFAGISMVPDSADKDYPQAPNCAVYTAREIVSEYGDAAVWTSGLIELALQGWDGDLWDACVALLKDDYDPHEPRYNESGFGPTSDEIMVMAQRKRFWEKSRKFAKKYFGGDVKRLAYCMKDVYNWKKWKDLKESLVIVDYTELVETTDNTKLEEEVACAGGACSI